MIPLIIGLLPLIPHIVSGVELLWGKGNGAQKKQAALGLIADAANGFEQFTAPGAPGANSALMKLISTLIDATVAYMNETGQFQHQQ